MAVTQINTQQYKDDSVTEAKVSTGVIVASGAHAFTGDQSMGSNKITSLANGTNANDAVNKSQLDAAVVGLLDYKGGFDASGNPNYPAASKGDTYAITVAGKVGGASGREVDVGDYIIANADNAGGTEASVGASWDTLEHNLVGALLASLNLSDLEDPDDALTNLGGTTVGKALFKVTNPSAIRFIRVNADNTVTLLSASDFRTAIGASGGTQAVRETPSGTVNGSNTDFVLANTPVAGSEMIFVNGILQDSGSGNDYTISGSTITFLTGAIPQSGDKIRVTYTY